MPNPLAKDVPDPCVLVIFGASGDLTARKLIPALYQLDQQGRLPEALAVLGVSRTSHSDDEWRRALKPWVQRHAEGFTDEHWSWFSGRLHYLSGSATNAELYPVLIERLNQIAADHKQHGPSLASASPLACQPNVLFYLAVAPKLIQPIMRAIGDSGMVYEGKRWCAIDAGAVPWQRIIVEKPIGHDYESGEEINRTVGRVFEEEAVYRIDHYLGKELIQNILVMRFANTIFEPVWNNQHVDQIQVTAAESVGVGRRAANYYDTAGATRDMLQSHLLQVMALVAMEPPPSYDATAIRREKIKALDSVRLITEDEAPANAAFGRYGASGDAEDEDGGFAYVDLPDVDRRRRTETYSAVRLFVDNWRWTGVPFYLRSGKKMARKLTEVVVQFKQPPANLFRHVEPFRSGAVRPPNRLVINIAPDDGVSLRFEAKVPGPTLQIGSVKADFDYQYVFKATPIEAYGPLLLDAMRGDQTLFKHRDELSHAWRIVDPMLGSEPLLDAIEEYASHSWGPSRADELLGKLGHSWHNPAPSETR